MKIMIEIAAEIPYKDFSFESRDLYIRAVIALFRGLFPTAAEMRDEPPITVTVDPLYEDENDKD